MGHDHAGANGPLLRVENLVKNFPVKRSLLSRVADQVHAVAAAASSWPRDLVALAVAAEDAGNPVVPLVDEVLARQARQASDG